MGVRAFQTGLTGGELSPFLFARSDFDKYRNGAELLLNCVVKVSGGCARRAGSQYIAEAKPFYSAFQFGAFQVDAFQVNPAGSLQTRLVPFVFNIDQAYVLEFGHQYIRFFRNRAPLFGEGVGDSFITNGDFSSGLTGWDTDSTGSGSVTDGGGYASLAVGAGLGDATLMQTITGLEVGERYIAEFRIDNAPAIFSLGTAPGGEDLVARQALAPGSYRVAFIPTTTEATLLFYNSSVSTETRVDDVVVQLSDVIELTTPYTNEDIPQLRFTQSADTLYIAHPDHDPRKLTRLSDTTWTLQIIAFQPVPSQETPLAPSATLTIGATSGANIVFTTDVAAFLDGDVNKTIRSRGGVAIIKTVDSATQVTVDIIQQFINTDPIGSGSWELVGSPSSAITLSAKEPVDSLITVTAALDSFRTSDVGGFIKVNSGLLEITAFTSATVVTARILTVPSSTSGVAGAWTLESAAWSSTQGFPGVVTFFEQRLWFASSRARPQTIWGSAVADFENFAAGPNDDDSVEFTIASNTVDLIRWMKSIRNFLIGTIGSEFKMAGGNESSITATNVTVTTEAAYGSDFNVDALRAGNAVLFLQRGGRQIRELSFAYETDSYNAPDLTILAEHRFREGIVDFARASAPDSFLFAVSADGGLNVCSYERPENVVAWTRYETQGDYKAVCVIPGMCGDADEVWTVVEREVGDFTKRFIEVFDGQLNTDAALNYEGGADGTAAIDALAGLSHLEGMEVDVKWAPASAFQESAFQRGFVQGSRPEQYFTTTVASGFVSLPGPAYRVEVGLHYETEIKTLRQELAGPQGTAMFRRKRSNAVYVRFYCSHGPGMFVEDEEVPTDFVSRIRDFRKVNLGWDREGQVTIRQTQPFGMVVLGVGYSYVMDDGEAP
jgi:hypothetical protein